MGYWERLYDMKKNYFLFFFCLVLVSFYSYVFYLALHPKVSAEYDLYYIQKKLRHWSNGSGLDYQRGHKVVFSDNVSYVSRAGWSYPEKFGTWSDGDVAELFIKSDIKLSEIELEISPFLVPDMGLKEQIISFYVNGFEIDHKVLNINDSVVLRIKIPQSIPLESNFYIFKFEYPNAVSPLNLGISNDPRKLAFAYNYIKFN